MQQYIVIVPGEAPFFTNWMSPEMFPAKEESICINTYNGTYSTDGENWQGMEEVHL